MAVYNSMADGNAQKGLSVGDLVKTPKGGTWQILDSGIYSGRFQTLRLYMIYIVSMHSKEQSFRFDDNLHRVSCLVNIFSRLYQPAMRIDLSTVPSNFSIEFTIRLDLSFLPFTKTRSSSFK